MNWRVRDLLSEAWSNLRAAPARTFLLVGLTAALMAGLAYTEAATTYDLVDFNRRYVEAGGNAVVVYSDSGLAVDSCATFKNANGVLASGALSSPTAVETDGAPGTLFNTAAGTSGLWDVIATDELVVPDPGGNGWTIGAAAAEELGLAPGMMLGIEGRIAPVERVVDTELRDPQASRSIMASMAPTGTAVQCWIEYVPGVSTGRTEAAAAVFAGSGDAIAAPLIRLDEFSRDTLAELAERPTRYGWILAGAVIALTVWVMAWFRRSDIGLYRALGTRTSGLTIIGSAEALIPLVAGAVVGTMWGVVVAGILAGESMAADQWSIVGRSVASGLLLAIVAAPLPWAIASREPIADQLKDR